MRYLRAFVLLLRFIIAFLSAYFRAFLMCLSLWGFRWNYGANIGFREAWARSADAFQLRQFTNFFNL